jgi:hypothetical protein
MKGKIMIRPYMPEWLKSDGVEFALEIIAAIALGFTAVSYLLG